ncbi:aspartyl-phosphate phosphatase Spo0E family protein [Peribacillus loiseleuriae]|uniref:aspartyl-phosphate phosphatase Spo0E family protein n=1 Tax=Peribacillus loiseleuriae TaxID=1679170 RepID=UPI003D04E074
MEIKELILNDLENKINTLRILLISIGTLKGLNHPDTIKCSQELDVFLNKYQRIKLIRYPE